MIGNRQAWWGVWILYGIGMWLTGWTALSDDASAEPTTTPAVTAAQADVASTAHP